MWEVYGDLKLYLVNQLYGVLCAVAKLMQFCTPLQTSLMLHTVYEIKCIMDQTPPYRSQPLVVHQGSHHAWKEMMHVSIYQLCC